MEAKRLAYLILASILLTAGCRKGPTAEDTTPTGRLHLAAQKGDIKLVQSLLARGCDVDAKDKHGRTPLFTAAIYGQTKAAEFLISKGADVNAKNLYGGTALHAAAAGGHADIGSLLIAAGADVNAGKENGRTPLYETRSFEQKEMAELLLAHGAQVVTGDTYENRHLLSFAVRSGLRRLVEKLLVGGTSPNVVDVGYNGTTTLGEAVIHGDREMAMLLIAHGADINKRDASGRAPVDYANSFNKDVVELLLARGAHVNDEAALYAAVERGDKELMELFLARGADVNAKGYRGDTALDEAIARGHKDIAELLRKHGAK